MNMDNHTTRRISPMERAKSRQRLIRRWKVRCPDRAVLIAREDDEWVALLSLIPNQDDRAHIASIIWWDWDYGNLVGVAEIANTYRDQNMSDEKACKYLMAMGWSEEEAYRRTVKKQITYTPRLTQANASLS